MVKLKTLIIIYKDKNQIIKNMFISFYFKICHECFNVMLRGMHYISNASRILLVNILFAFDFIKMMVMYVEINKTELKIELKNILSAEHVE